MSIVKVKVQVSLFPPDGPALIYEGRGRKRMVEQDTLPPSVVTALRGDTKGYFKATWRGTYWDIGERVENQPW